MHRVDRIAPLSAARIGAALYFVMGCAGGVFLAFADRAFTSAWTKMALAVGIPFLYGFMGGILGAVGAWLYNVAARRLGGVEFTISRVDPVGEVGGGSANGGDAASGIHVADGK